MTETMRSIPRKRLVVIAVLTALMGLLILYVFLRDDARLISGKQLEILQSKKLITAVIHKEPYLYISTRKSHYKLPAQAAESSAVWHEYPVTVRSGDSVWVGLMYLMVIAGIFALLVRFLLARSLPLKIQAHDTATAKPGERSDVIQPMRSSVRFADVAGIKDAKDELEEIIDFLKNPNRYHRLGIRLPKGVLLVGPPGVGKTFAAKAVAGEANVPFFYQSGASFVHIYVGMGPKRVRELFQAAKRMAPSIVFIDEIDAVGRHRGSQNNDEREATLNQLLMEMDGFEENSGVIIMAATNRMEMLDTALLRPGRFDRRIHLTLPDPQERAHALSLYLADKPNRVTIDTIAHMTVGFSMAALETLVNEAALHALRVGKSEIDDADFDAVREKVISGKRKILSFDDEERAIQAACQSAKAAVATWLDVPFEKIGIVMTRLEEEEHEISSRTSLLNRIKVHLSGAIVAQRLYNEQYSNAAADKAAAIHLAEQMVYEYGMSEAILPAADETESLLNRAQRETAELMGKLEEARVLMEKHILEYENIDQEVARDLIRDLF